MYQQGDGSSSFAKTLLEYVNFSVSFFGFIIAKEHLDLNKSEVEAAVSEQDFKANLQKIDWFQVTQDEAAKAGADDTAERALPRWCSRAA